MAYLNSHQSTRGTETEGNEYANSLSFLPCDSSARASASMPDDNSMMRTFKINVPLVPHGIF
jgi:hypothetical protein